MLRKKNKITNIFNYLNTDWLIISLLNTDVKKNYSLENRMRRQTSGWVTCAKRSRRNTDPGVSHTFSRCIENSWRKKNYQMFYLNLWSTWNWVFCGESWKSLLPIFLMFHRTDFGGFLVCCYKAIQQLNGVEKNYVTIRLMLNHNLTGLKTVAIIIYNV